MMINNNIHVRVVESLRTRKKTVEKVYGIAGALGFWIPVLFFGFQVVFHVSRLLVANVGAISMLFSDMVTESELTAFIESFNLPMLAACIAFSVMGYFAFAARRRAAKYIYIAMCGVFAVVSVLMIIREFWVYMYISSAVYCVGMLFVAWRCVKAQDDDELLKKSDGYPHFNTIFMQDEVVEHSLLQFPDKKSYDELYEERMEQYAEINPDSETAKAYNMRKEEKKEMDIENWLTGMMEKTGEKAKVQEKTDDITYE